MTFLEHLDELRKRITHAVVALLVGFLIAFAFIDRVQSFVYQRLTADIPGGKLIFTEPGEAFLPVDEDGRAHRRADFLAVRHVAGVALHRPGALLEREEARDSVRVTSSGLFIGGAAFSHYFVFPCGVEILRGLLERLHGVHASHRPGVRALREAVLGMGLVFQLPMLMFVLARFGIVTAGFLLKNFKYAVLIIFVVAAVITPDGSIR